MANSNTALAPMEATTAVAPESPMACRQSHTSRRIATKPPAEATAFSRQDTTSSSIPNQSIQRFIVQIGGKIGFPRGARGGENAVNS